MTSPIYQSAKLFEILELKYETAANDIESEHNCTNRTQHSVKLKSSSLIFDWAAYGGYTTTIRLTIK